MYIQLSFYQLLKECFYHKGNLSQINMPAYYSNSIKGFLKEKSANVNNALTSGYANDGFFQLLCTQTKSWSDALPLILNTLNEVKKYVHGSENWGVLLEYPLHRLRKRIDMVIIARNLLFIIEFKVGAYEVSSADIRQTEDFTLDLRDFHKASHDLPMQPILCCTNLQKTTSWDYDSTKKIQEVKSTGIDELPSFIKESFNKHTSKLNEQFDIKKWNLSKYEPVPTIIEAATTIFAGHSVKEISRFDADNLAICSSEVLNLIEEAKRDKKKRIIVVTGVPGAGKTLAGLNVVHASHSEKSIDGKVVYLSGNTPLVLVIREALAQDEKVRAERNGKPKLMKDIRHELKTRIQHINDFLKEYYQHDLERPPHENAIVFDEAQRAWDHKQGKDKFNRDASEPELLMQIMDRHKDWAAIICLVGAGQEINSGETGMKQWGDAVMKDNSWEIIAPETALTGNKMAGTSLFPEGVPSQVNYKTKNNLSLNIPLRSYRSERVSDWVDAVLENRPEDAKNIYSQLGDYPITLVRSINECRDWLKSKTKGTRRCGLLASAGASRLRADGLGVALTVQDKGKIAHWYLQPHGDYRSSNALEVTSNEYTSQGLEIDFAGVCWGGDLIRNKSGKDWHHRALSKTSWNNVHKTDRKRFINNKYRVFLTRAREGMVIFVPKGDSADNTRNPRAYNSVAKYLIECGLCEQL